MAIFQRLKKTTDTAPTSTTTPSVKRTVASVDVSVIFRPMITEKAAHLSAVGQYVFEVSQKANKIQVRQAIRQMYGVTPVSVNIQNRDGKMVRRGRTSGTRKNWKKAIVTLPKGKKIEVYEGV